MSDTIEILYKDQEGNECLFLTRKKWLLDELETLAEYIAHEDMCDAGSDLDDPAQWPRKYEIEINKEWKRVSVDMEYNPIFQASILEEGDSE